MADKKYLDQTGLIYLWSKIKALIKTNDKDNDGYVAKGIGHANQVWKTDANGVPAWRDDADTWRPLGKGATDAAAGDHTHTPSEVGLGNVGNFKAVSTVAGQGLTEAEQAAARANIGAGASGFSGDYNDLTNKPDLKTVATTGSYNDLIDKPTHLSGDIATSEKGVANGVATLGSDGKVPSSQLPSYVDDVVEYGSKSDFPATGEAGKIYIAKDTNLTYRWGGTAYVEISPSLALGETSSTAYAGDKGKAVTDNLNVHVTNTTVHITAEERTAWNAKGSYSKPSGGIPKIDLASGIQTSLDKADAALLTSANQGLTDTQQSNAIANLGLVTITNDEIDTIVSA